MNELDVSLKIAHAFKALGYDANKTQDAIVCPNPKCRRKIVPERGKPDRTMIHPSVCSCYVEVKTVRRDEMSFSFSEISTEQRATLDDWRVRGGLGYLALGIIRRPKRNDRLTALYVVEWGVWRALERQVEKHQSSIPVVAGPGFARELQKKRLDIETQLRAWGLVQIKGGWAFNVHHPIFKHTGAKLILK